MTAPLWTVALALCVSAASAGPWDDRVAPLVTLPEPADLRVLVWNVQTAASEFREGPEKALAWVRAVNADVVLMQESYDIEGDRPTLGRWIAAELGWNQHQGSSDHLCVLTPHTIEATFHHHDWHGVGARIRDDAGRSFVAFSIWIDWQAYITYALRDDPAVSDADLLLNETKRSGRLNQAEGLLASLREQGHMDAAVPLLVGGDWNCPSHLDWTAEASKVFRFRRPLPLPVSTRMHDAGFADAFRIVHADPVQRPGITWSPLYLGTAEIPETADRIDRLYIRSGPGAAVVTPVLADVLPRRPEDPSLPQADRVFPSDHGAVVIDLSWQTQPPPPTE